MLTKKLRNPFERKISTQLKKAKIVFSYEPEKIPYIIAGHYWPDFVITTKTGKVYIETKGHFRVDDKRKLRCVKKQHPELDIRIIFYESRKSNIKWAERYGFKYAIGKIPKDWMEGL